jgi:hypothetical protein
MNRNVHHLRPAGINDLDNEARTVRLDVHSWTLVLIVLRDAPLQAAHDLADQIEAKLQHPSSHP